MGGGPVLLCRGALYGVLQYGTSGPYGWAIFTGFPSTTA